MKYPAQVKMFHKAMRAKGWEPDDAAKLSESSNVEVSLCGRYLRGEVKVGEKNAPAIADALGLTLEQVLYGKKAA